MAELEDLFARAGSEVASAVTRPDAAELRDRGLTRARRRTAGVGVLAAVVIAGGAGTALALLNGSTEETLTPAGATVQPTLPSDPSCTPTSAEDATRTPADDPPLAPDATGGGLIVDYAGGPNAPDFSGFDIAVAEVVSMQAPVQAGGEPTIWASTSIEPVSTGREVNVMRPVRFTITRVINGAVPRCLDLFLPGGSTGDRFTEETVSHELAAGDRVLLRALRGGYQVAVADPDGLVTLPPFRQPPVDLDTWVLPTAQPKATPDR